MGGAPLGIRHPVSAGGVGHLLSWTRSHSPHDRRGTDVDVGFTHPYFGRPHRDALSYFRLAGFPGILSRWAGAPLGFLGGGLRPLSPRSFLAGIGLRYPNPQFLALDRAYGLGALRRPVPVDRHEPES